MDGTLLDQSKDDKVQVVAITERIRWNASTGRFSSEYPAQLAEAHDLMVAGDKVIFSAL